MGPHTRYPCRSYLQPYSQGRRSPSLRAVPSSRVGRGKENRRRDQRSRAVQPGAI
ncbi:MAG: hypothetical protein MZV64_34925 [Ignavibacteriales bacterium]|nr:hypothetical protein [Ignavibacteriales bacterium]